MDSIYFGIDLGEKNTIVSFYDGKSKDPTSVSVVMGRSEYKMPTMIAKREGIEQWFYGRDAKDIMYSDTVIEVSNLYSKAINNEEVIIEDKKYIARDLLAMFIKYFLSLTYLPYYKNKNTYVIITVPILSTDVIEMCSYIARKLDIEETHLFIIDYMEAFYFYALNQEKETFDKNVVLFECDSEEVKYDVLSLDKNETPINVNVKCGVKTLVGEKKDIGFYNIIKNMSDIDNASSIYLVGDGFDGGWLKDSMKYLLNGRRVFIGKNLYSKGACFYGHIKNDNIPWNYYYMGSNELKLNVSLKVTEDNEKKFYVLQHMGESWFKNKSELEVILIGDKEIDFWIQKFDNRVEKIKKVVLKGLPDRKSGTTRLKILSKAVSDREIIVSIIDLGFGEIAPSSGLKWEYRINMEELN